MTRFTIPPPFSGVSSEEALVSQKRDTTRDASNVRGYDARSKRKRIAQRPGTRKYASTQVNGAAKVTAIAPVSYDNRNQTYGLETLGSEPTVSSTKGPSTPWSVPVMRHDSLGNRYFIDGKSTVVKMNTDNVVVWLLPLPIKQAQTQVRALWIDDDDMVYVGTSAGLGQEKCKIFKYRQVKDNKTELVWTVDTDAFIEDLAIRNGRMATIQNSPRDNSAALVVYDGLFFPAGPLEAWRHKIAYPGNCLAISPKDASLFVASQANATRGVIPADPLLSQTSTHWTPEQLPYWGQRAYSWLDGTDIDGDDSANAAYTDGSPIDLWADKTGNGRHLYKRAGADAPTLNVWGIAGRDCLRFTDGTGGTNVQALVSGTNTSTDRSGSAQHGTLLPGYVGAGWALFAVVRTEAVATIRQFLIQNLDGAGAYDAAVATDVGLFLNTKANGASGRQAASGGVFWNDSNTRVGATLVQIREQYSSHEHVSPYEKSDVCLISIVYDGTPYGASATPNACTLRVDGRVAQSWHLDANKSWTGATELGFSVNAVAGASAFRGNVGEILVLRDYQETPGGTRKIIDTTWTSGTDFPSEMHLVEGYLAHKWGVSHKLPAGAHGAVTFTGAGNATNNDTVTIDGQAYRFRNAGLLANYDVTIGANGTATLVNLGHCINGTGTAGTDYFAGTPVHTTVRALESYQPLGITAAADPGLVLISLGASTTSFTMASAGATPPNTVAGTTTFRSGDNANYAHQLHPFWYQPTGINTGGPPVDLGVNTTSPEGLLTNVGPLLAKYEPGRGEVQWVVTNPTTTNLGVGGIGYGVAVSKDGYIFSMGPPSSTTTAGPTNDQLRSTNAVFRGIKDLGTTVVVDHTLNGDNTVPWIVHNGASDSPPTGPWYAPEYAYPRPDTDEFNNCYMPWSSVYTTYGAVLLFPQGTAISGSALRHTFPEFQRALCVSGDPAVPDYSPDAPNVFEFTDSGTTREAQYVLTSTGVLPTTGETTTIGSQVYTWLNPFVDAPGNVAIGATAAICLQRLKAAINNEAGAGTTYGTATARNALAGCVAVTSTTLTVRSKTASVALTVAEGSATLSWGTQILKDNTVHRKRLVKTTPTTGSPRAHMLVVVAGTDVKRATGGAIASLASSSGAGAIDASAQYISWAVVGGKVYLTDGIRRTPFVVNPKTLLGSALAADSGGQVPPRCKLLAGWGPRLVLARGLHDGSGIYLSESGNPAGWNFKPPVPSPKQAYDLQLPNSSGSVPDTVQALSAITDDLLVVGCQSSVHRITGDPALGGVVHEITTATGTAFGRSITKDEKGNIYFAAFPEAAVWAMPPGAFDPVEITEHRIQSDLGTIDWSLYTLELLWDPQREGLWLIQVPFANPGIALKRWFWERKNNAWWPDTDADTTRAPTTIGIVNADLAAHRGVLFGCADGYIRVVDDDARNDDGKAILSHCLFGPLAPSEVAVEFTFDDLAAVLATEQDGVAFEAFATADPSDLGRPVAIGEFSRGRDDYQNIRATGAYVAIKLKNYALQERWALEELSIDTWAAGIKRNSRGGRA